MKNGYIKSLDGVRAIAILLVMSFHANLNHFGWMGVQLFFVLSGFLITGILWKEKDGPGSIGEKLRSFWVRRSLRIFPLYFGFLLLIGVIYLISSFPSYYPRYILYLVTYTFNYTRTFSGWEGNPLFTHFWSLSIEEQFYLFFPLVVFLMPRNLTRVLMISALVAAPFIRWALFRYFETSHTAEVAADAVYWHTLSHLDAFFIGGLIPVLSLDKKIRGSKALLLISFFAAIAAGLMAYLGDPHGSYTWSLGYGHGQVSNFEYAWHYTPLNILFASLLLFLISGRASGLHSFFEHPLLIRIGRVSYGMYIFHWAILVYGFNQFFPHTAYWQKLLLFIPYTGVVYGVAEISFRLYESRFLVLKDRFFPKQVSKLTMPAEQESMKGS